MATVIRHRGYIRVSETHNEGTDVVAWVHGDELFDLLEDWVGERGFKLGQWNDPDAAFGYARITIELFESEADAKL